MPRIAAPESTTIANRLARVVIALWNSVGASARVDLFALFARDARPGFLVFVLSSGNATFFIEIRCSFLSTHSRYRNEGGAFRVAFVRNGVS
jgi:hypothetical protein